MDHTKVYRTMLSALLCAIGILIPMFSPLKIILEPASFTLGSHVPIFIAMFISPASAIFVSLGTTIGFFFGGFPFVVVLRALSHVIFASLGAFYLSRRTQTIESFTGAGIFSFFIALIHALCEIFVVTPLYFNNSMAQGYYSKGFVVSVVLLVGLGTVIHSMVDFQIALYVWKPIKRIARREISSD